MKWATTSYLLAALWLAPTRAQSAARRPETAQISGKEYVRAADWAKANGFEVRWLKTDETLQLSNHRAKLVLGVDSREAEVNGVVVWLLFPAALRNGTIYLARLDLQTTLQPLLWPPKNRSGSRIKSICLDPGHGGKQPGNCVGAYQEKKYTLLL